MKRVRIRSAEDLDALPEGEWVEVVGGMKFTSVYGPFRVDEDKLVVELPEHVQKRFKRRSDQELHARITKGELIVTRRPKDQAKRRRK